MHVVARPDRELLERLAGAAPLGRGQLEEIAAERRQVDASEGATPTRSGRARARTPALGSRRSWKPDPMLPEQFHAVKPFAGFPQPLEQGQTNRPSSLAARQGRWISRVRRAAVLFRACRRAKGGRSQGTVSQDSGQAISSLGRSPHFTLSGLYTSRPLNRLTTQKSRRQESRLSQWAIRNRPSCGRQESRPSKQAARKPPGPVGD